MLTNLVLKFTNVMPRILGIETPIPQIRNVCQTCGSVWEISFPPRMPKQMGQFRVFPPPRHNGKRTIFNTTTDCFDCTWQSDKRKSGVDVKAGIIAKRLTGDFREKWIPGNA